MAKHFFWKPFKEQIADMYEKVTEVLKRQYTYFENVNLFYNGNWLSILSTAQRRADTRVRYLFMSVSELVFISSTVNRLSPKRHRACVISH